MQQRFRLCTKYTSVLKVGVAITAGSSGVTFRNTTAHFSSPIFIWGAFKSSSCKSSQAQRRCRKRGQCKEFLLGDMAGLALGPRQWFSSCSCPGKGSLPARQRPADRGRRHRSGQGAPPRPPAPAGSPDPSSGWASGFRGRPWRREPRGRTQTCRRTSHQQPDKQGDTLSHVCQEYRPLYNLITPQGSNENFRRGLNSVSVPPPKTQ